MTPSQELLSALASHGAEPAKGADAPDPDCICHGNWRSIVKKTEHLIDRKFRDHRGKVWSFYGIVHGGDDYYYGMWRPCENLLSSCVGSLEGTFDLIPEGENAEYDRASPIKAEVTTGEAGDKSWRAVSRAQTVRIDALCKENASLRAKLDEAPGKALEDAAAELEALAREQHIGREVEWTMFIARRLRASARQSAQAASQPSNPET